jgi:hypothetical protein
MLIPARPLVAAVWLLLAGRSRRRCGPWRTGVGRGRGALLLLALGDG